MVGYSQFKLPCFS